MFKKLFSKLISRKFWGGLILANLLISGLQVPKVLAQNPVWNSFSGEQEFLKVGYQSADGSKIIEYADQVTAPTEAKAGDLIKARIYFHNGNPGTIATNAIAKLTGVSGESSKFTPSASLSADFTETVTDMAEINLPKSFKLEFVTGSTKKWTLSDPVNGPDRFDKIVSLSDGITTDNGVNFGDPKINGIEGCWEFRGFITLWLRLTEVSPPAGSVTIKKTVVDKNDNPLTDPNDLKGFEFKIKGKGIDQTVVTDEKGEAKFANLPIGPYEVSETPRTGYEIISTMPVLVNISNANLNWELKIKNRKLEEPQPIKGTVKVVKTLLAEAGKEIVKPNDLYKNWQIVLKGIGFEKTALTNERGEVSFIDLNLGAYEVNQASKADWLTQTNLPILVNLSEQNPNATVTITDKAKEQPVFGSIRVKKILLDENGREVTRPNEKLAGFEFKISGDGFVKAAVTANDGLVSFNNLALVNYEISETARSGYRIKTSLPILAVLSKADPNQEVSVTNEIISVPPVKGQITVEKRLLDDKGVLIPVSDIRYKDWTIKLAGQNGFNQNLITDQGGKVVFATLDLGQYEVNQVVKSDWLTQTNLPILVNLSQANPAHKVIIEDKLKEVVEPPVSGRIKTIVNLIDENDNPITKPSDLHKDWEIILKGIDFEKRLKTDTQGTVDFTDLKLGTYELDQILKDSWEELSLLPMAITLTKENNSYVIGITNGKISEPPEPKGLVRIVKTLRDENGQPINPPSSQLIGFEFKLIDANGLARTASTDSNGKIEFSDLPLGKYTLNETPGSGYQIVTQMPIEFELTKDLSGVQISVENKKLATAVPDLQIKKYVSGDNGNTWFNKDKDNMILAAKPGGQLLYKIVIWNTGNADAQNVKIIDIIANEQFYQSIERPNMIIDLVSAKDNKTEAAGKVITYKAVLKNNFPEWETILDNIAYIDGDDVSKSSVARASVFVMPVIPPLIIDRTIVTEVIREVNTGGAPAIFTEKTVRNLTRGDNDYSNQTNAAPGEEVEYKIYFRNNTEFEAIDIGLRDVLPSGLTLISGSARLNRGGVQGALGDFVDDWINSLGNYKTNEEAFVIFRARLTDDIKDGSILVNTAYIAPRDFAIASDTALINVVKEEQAAPVSKAAPKGELPKAGANVLLLSLTSLIGSILGYAGTRFRDEKHFLKEMKLSYKMK